MDLTNASVELIGDFSSLFSVPLAESAGRQYRWQELCELIPVELRNNSVVGIRQLTAVILKGDNDNYHVVTTPKRDKSFRLFVSKVITYVSQRTEIHIYVVQMITREYGDPFTTRLLKAISAGLRFRFLVLEEGSEFRLDKLGHPIVNCSDLQKKISELMGQMDLIFREAEEANLSDPEMLIAIWGEGKRRE